ncbi:MAG: hypothetical protein IKO72_03310 [Kiritimatiellae bacterium]|nr:hypothetical protein [Kiritimatiellia bacterium]
MHEIDETDFPPIPPPPPMTVEQRDMAEASIRAAIAREAERNAARRHVQIMAAGECCAFELASCAKRQPTSFSRRRKVVLPAIDLPENKPRKPNLNAANLSFAARVIIWVRDRYDNNAPAIYKAAYLSRKTYSAIISDENHVVSKRTAIQLAFGLRLSREEADLLLHAAGYHLSRSVVEDMIFDACLEAKIHNLEDVNHFLIAYECRPFVPQE